MKKLWYRDRKTGDRGFLVQVDGEDFIQLDRPMEVVRRKFRKDDWKEDQALRPMTRAQVAQIAFFADTALCRFLGLHKESRREWLSLKDEERQALIETGIDSKNRLRRRLWQAVMVALDGESA